MTDEEWARLVAIAAAATPGPWTPMHRHVDTDSTDWQLDELGGLGWEIQTPLGYLEAPMRGLVARGADAHLMAAAPRLMELLQRLDKLLTAKGCGHEMW